jgi:hypothetical protein
MTAVADTEKLPAYRSPTVWALLLALLLHALWLTVPIHLSPTAPAPTRVDVQNIPNQQLEAIRRQWRERGLLTPKDVPASEKAPDDAKYMSDRNIRVEREQRARDTTVLPRRGAQNQTGDQTRPAPQQRPQEQARPRNNYPPLGDLGIKYRLPPKRQPPPQAVGGMPNAQSSGQAAGDQAILDDSLPVGSENLLNAQESIYYSFYARIYEAIAPVWESGVRNVLRTRPVPEGDYLTVVDVIFDANGNLLRVTYRQRSSSTDLDQVVEGAWTKAAPFPNPPRELIDERGEFHIGYTFTVRVGSGFGAQFLPPERIY